VITRIEALGFRSLRYVAQDVGPFEILVGPNGSGKSAFLDVVAFLGDLLRVGPMRAISGDWPLGVPFRAVDPAHLCWMRRGLRFELAVEVRIPEERAAKLPNDRVRLARYEVALDVGHDDGEVRVDTETLWLKPESEPERTSEEMAVQRLLFPDDRESPPSIVQEPHRKTPLGWRKVVNKIGASGNDYFMAETSGWNSPFRLGPTRLALANLPEDESRFPVATWMKRVLMEGIDRVALNADAMRSPSPPGTPRTFVPDGSNLPWWSSALEGLSKSDSIDGSRM
jgi:hypothetical protein